MLYEDIGDSELIYMIGESSEEAKEVLYDKYKYIIDIVIKKYLTTAKVLGYDYNDLYQDALVGFSDAISGYREDKDSSLATFITLCVDRRLQYSIRGLNNKKAKLNAESLSLDYIYENSKVPLRDIISDDSLNDPLIMALKRENYEDLLHTIKDNLSKMEWDVFELMIRELKYIDIASILNIEPKQVDNSMQRIKKKIRSIIDNNREDM